MARTQYRSMRGKVVDMDKIRSANQLTPAVSNMRLNARGDLIGPGNKVLKTREELFAEYNKKNTKAVKQASISDKNLLASQFLTPEEAMKQQQELRAKLVQQQNEQLAHLNASFQPLSATQPTTQPVVQPVPAPVQPEKPMPTNFKISEESLNGGAPPKPSRGRKIIQDK